jgi:hypothetical protein
VIDVTKEDLPVIDFVTSTKWTFSRIQPFKTFIKIKLIIMYISNL